MKIKLTDIDVAKDETGVPLNPRTGIDTTDLQGTLSDPLIGQLEPVIVTQTENGRWLLLAGHRRVVAARALGWSTIWAEPKDLPDRSDNTLRAAMLAAHAHEVHDPLKVAGAIRAMLSDGYDKLRVARIMAISPQRVDVLLSLAEAPASVQAAVAHNRMTLSAYGQMYAQPKAVQAKVVERVTAQAEPDGKGKRGRPAGPLTVAAVRREVQAIAAEENPRLLDDEAMIEKLNGALVTIAEIVTQYAGGLPDNLAWRVNGQLMDARDRITALLEVSRGTV